MNSALTYTASTAGTFYVAAAAYGTSTGSYELIVYTAPTPAPFNPVDALTWGTQLGDSTVTVYFGAAGFSTDGYTSEAFNAYERAQFQAAFDLIEATTNLEFNVVTTAADADFRLYLDTNKFEAGLLGFFYPPGNGSSSGIGVFNGSAWDRNAGGDLEQGGGGFQTIVHELLHGLGLSHPHDDGGSSTVLSGVTEPFRDYGDFDSNQGVFTTMSYNRGFSTTGNSTSGYSSGPMALDLAVLQTLYGANTSHNQGGNMYILPGSNGAGTFWQSIWDTGGIDEIRHNGANGATINLRAATLAGEVGGGGFVSSAVNIAGGFTIANGVVIENAAGGSGNDVLTGNDASNRLIGNAGNDQLTGGSDADLSIFNSFNASGISTVTDFEIGLDMLRLVGTSLGSDPFDSLNMSDIVIGGQNAVLINYGAHVVTLVGLQETYLSTDDFLFT